MEWTTWWNRLQLFFLYIQVIGESKAMTTASHGKNLMLHIAEVGSPIDLPQGITWR